LVVLLPWIFVLPVATAMVFRVLTRPTSPVTAAAVYFAVIAALAFSAFWTYLYLFKRVRGRGGIRRDARGR